MRFVFDTNILISACLRSNSLPALALKHAELSDAEIIYSDLTLAEISRVLRRDKFSSFICPEDVLRIINKIKECWIKIEVPQGKFSEDFCRDRRDNKFLTLALAGKADAIVTGDKDLLSLDPFEGIHIIQPEQYMQTFFNRNLFEQHQGNKVYPSPCQEIK